MFIRVWVGDKIQPGSELDRKDKKRGIEPFGWSQAYHGKIYPEDMTYARDKIVRQELQPELKLKKNSGEYIP